MGRLLKRAPRAERPRNLTSAPQVAGSIALPDQAFGAAPAALWAVAMDRASTCPAEEVNEGADADHRG